MIPEEQEKNFETFRDCLSTVLIERISRPDNSVTKKKKRTRNKKKSSTSQESNRNLTFESIETTKESDGGTVNEKEEDLGSPEELADFVDYIASETFAFLPEELKTAEYHGWTKDAALQARYVPPFTGADIAELMPTLDPAIGESLAAYGIIAGGSSGGSGSGGVDIDRSNRRNPQGVEEILAPVLGSLVASISTAPPAPRSTKPAAQEAGCEICGRNWINLSYHHLIPRFVHDKAVKRGWHRAEDLENVAWLCGACHRFVHRFANHEDLARKYHTVDLLLEQNEVVRWAEWVGKLRWKGR